jgi:ADP-ribose pyrophosphatase YjhB (NUDIX family)
MASTALLGLTSSATYGSLAIGFAPSSNKGMSKPRKHSVAVVIPKANSILTVRRPDDDDELPGIWGLPAGTCKGEETVQDVIVRIGREKLGVELKPVRCLASGNQDRTGYLLYMELWEVAMTGTPRHPEWRWVPVEFLRPGAAAGSLCCELALKTQKPR